jgi:hypothetical protein
MGGCIQSISKEDSDLPGTSQVFGVPHLARPAEPLCRKKTSYLLDPNSNYKKIDP